MSKEIELLKSALEIVIKNPDLSVEVKFRTKVFHINEAPKKKVAEKKTEKKDVVADLAAKTKEEKKESEKPKAGSGTVDEFDVAISKSEQKKAETKIEPDSKNTGEEKIIPKDNIGDVEAATEDEPKLDEPKKVKLPDGAKHCVACGGTGIGSKGQKCVPCKGTGIEQSKAPEKKVDLKAEGKPKEEKKAEGKKNDDDDWVF